MRELFKLLYLLTQIYLFYGEKWMNEWKTYLKTDVDSFNCCWILFVEEISNCVWKPKTCIISHLQNFCQEFVTSFVLLKQFEMVIGVPSTYAWNVEITCLAEGSTFIQCNFIR